MTGTHLGDWRDLPAMGRRMESRVCALYSFDEKGMLASSARTTTRRRSSSSSASSRTRARRPARSWRRSRRPSRSCEPSSDASSSARSARARRTPGRTPPAGLPADLGERPPDRPLNAERDARRRDLRRVAVHDERDLDEACRDARRREADAPVAREPEVRAEVVVERRAGRTVTWSCAASFALRKPCGVRAGMTTVSPGPIARVSPAMSRTKVPATPVNVSSWVGWMWERTNPPGLMKRSASSSSPFVSSPVRVNTQRWPEVESETSRGVSIRRTRSNTLVKSSAWRSSTTSQSPSVT